MPPSVVRNRTGVFTPAPRGRNGLDDTKPVDTWQHPVNDHDVVVFAGGKEKPLATVWRIIDNVSVLAEALNNMPRRHIVVFDQQNFHVGACSASTNLSLRERSLQMRIGAQLGSLVGFIPVPPHIIA